MDSLMPRTTNTGTVLPPDASTLAFAQKLRRAIVERGWTQADLGRRATEHMAQGTISRNSISRYVSGKELPGDNRLSAIASALGMKPEELIDLGANRISSRMGAKVSVEDLGNGMTWVRINQEVPWAAALKILDILKGENDE